MGGSPTSWNQFNSIRMWNGKMRLLSSVDPGTWEEWMILRVTNIHFQWWWRWNWRPGGWGKARQQVDDKCEIIKIFLIITNFLDYYPKSIPEWIFPRLLLSPPSNTHSRYTVVVLMIVISPAAHPAPHPQCQFKVDREICGLYGISCSRDTGISDSLSTIWKGAMPPTLLPICYRLIITELAKENRLKLYVPSSATAQYFSSKLLFHQNRKKTSPSAGYSCYTWKFHKLKMKMTLKYYPIIKFYLFPRLFHCQSKQKRAELSIWGTHLVRQASIFNFSFKDILNKVIECHYDIL